MKISLKKSEIKIFLDKQKKQKNPLSVGRPVLNYILKEAIQKKGKLTQKYRKSPRKGKYKKN